LSELCFFSLTEAGVGAGTDSYYEYVLKAYVLLGDEKYLYRFDRVSAEIFLIDDSVGFHSHKDGNDTSMKKSFVFFSF
jgi:hypothetical protein